jgi:hypothetical protein
MSLRTFRHSLRSVLAGTALTMALSLLGSSPARAAEAPEPVHQVSFLDAAWEWLVESWAPADEPALPTQPVPDAEAERSALDAGWTIDPDG